MKPAITQIGQIIDQPHGRTLIKNWHFSFENLPSHRQPVSLTGTDGLIRFLDQDADDEDVWTVDELRAIQTQALELALLDESEAANG